MLEPERQKLVAKLVVGMKQRLMIAVEQLVEELTGFEVVALTQNWVEAAQDLEQNFVAVVVEEEAC